MDIIRKLIYAYGPSGEEDEIRDIILDEIKGYVDEIKVDRIGNIIALKRGKKKGKIMVSAHMDELGFMVTGVDGSGFVRFTSTTVIDPFTVLYQRVRFKNKILGIISGDLKSKELKLEELYIDIGAASSDNAQKYVGIGDMAVLQPEYAAAGNRMTAWGIGSRVGCIALVDTIRKVKHPTHDTYFVFTVQEESYMGGTAVSAYRVEPDMAVVIGAVESKDSPGGKKEIRLGDGPGIKIMEPGFICHHEVRDRLVSIAEKQGIKYQHEISKTEKTGGYEVHISKNGVPTGAVSIPVRYLHTPVETVDVNDIKGTIGLLSAMIEED